MTQEPTFGQIIVRTSDGNTFRGETLELERSCSDAEDPNFANHGESLDHLEQVMEEHGLAVTESLSLQHQQWSFVSFNPQHVVSVEIRRW